MTTNYDIQATVKMVPDTTEIDRYLDKLKQQLNTKFGINVNSGGTAGVSGNNGGVGTSAIGAALADVILYKALSKQSGSLPSQITSIPSSIGTKIPSSIGTKIPSSIGTNIFGYEKFLRGQTQKLMNYQKNSLTSQNLISNALYPAYIPKTGDLLKKALDAAKEDNKKFGFWKGLHEDEGGGMKIPGMNVNIVGIKPEVLKKWRQYSNFGGNTIENTFGSDFMAGGGGKGITLKSLGGTKGLITVAAAAAGVLSTAFIKTDIGFQKSALYEGVAGGRSDADWVMGGRATKGQTRAYNILTTPVVKQFANLIVGIGNMFGAKMNYVDTIQERGRLNQTRYWSSYEYNNQMNQYMFTGIKARGRNAVNPITAQAVDLLQQTYLNNNNIVEAVDKGIYSKKRGEELKRKSLQQSLDLANIYQQQLTVGGMVTGQAAAGTIVSGVPVGSNAYFSEGLAYLQTIINILRKGLPGKRLPAE
jgi:hypothetical protein